MVAWCSEIALCVLLAMTAPSSPDAPALDPEWTWVERPAGKPVIDRGGEGSWDAYAVDNPFLLVHDGSLYCFYEAQDKPFQEGGHEQVGLALSRGGVFWDKCRGNPILTVGPEGSWDSVVAKLPVVVRGPDGFCLFYSGKNKQTKQIGLATSQDLVHWEKHAANPVLSSRPGQWDKHLSTHPAPPYRHDGRYLLLYRGMTGFYCDQGLGVAVSEDLVRWRRLTAGPVIPTSEEIASFAVTRADGRYVGISQAPDRAYWFSDDLTHWQRGGAVRLTGPRVDTLSNPVWFEGEWVVLYEQGDRIFRAILEETE